MHRADFPVFNIMFLLKVFPSECQWNLYFISWMLAWINLKNCFCVNMWNWVEFYALKKSNQICSFYLFIHISKRKTFQVQGEFFSLLLHVKYILKKKQTVFLVIKPHEKRKQAEHSSLFVFFFERKTWQLLNLRILLGSDPSDSEFKGYYDSCDIISEHKITHIWK